MIIVCQSCNARLQIDDDKSPSGVFTIRCPKCKAAIQSSSSSSPASEQSAFGVGGSPSTEHPRYVPPTARAYQLTQVAEESDSSSSEEVLRTLMNLLGKGDPKDADKGARPSWSRRKALVCTSEQYREGIARSLT